MPHVHVSVLDFLIVFLYMLIGMLLLRLAEVHWGERPIGKALAFFH